MQTNPPDNKPKTIVVRDESSVNFLAWSGPIPPPEILEAYHKYLPSAPDRILTMAEKRAETNRRMESLGQIFGFILALVAISGAILLLYMGRTIGGLSGLIGTIGTFLWLEKRQSSPNRKKQH